jgi:hypothetical protein
MNPKRRLFQPPQSADWGYFCQSVRGVIAGQMSKGHYPV